MLKSSYCLSLSFSCQVNIEISFYISKINYFDRKKKIQNKRNYKLLVQNNVVI